MSSPAIAADSDANKYFLPLKLACDTGQARLVALALDSMEKLVAYGYLDGTCPASEEIYPSKKKEAHANAAPPPGPMPTPTPPPAAATAAKDGTGGAAEPAATGTGGSGSSGGGPEPAKARKLIHVMIETLYECSMYKDILVQRQVIKALLTTVSSVSCPVHDHGLLQAVTSCYQIYLQAGDETNRTTSRAALTQIFNIVFQRMEHFAAQLKQLDEAAAKQREADKAQSLKMNEGIPTASPRSATSHSGSSHGDADADADADAGAPSEGGSASEGNGVAADADGSASHEASQSQNQSGLAVDTSAATGAPASSSSENENENGHSDGSDGGGASTTVGTGQLDMDPEASQTQPVEPSLGHDESDGGGATPTASGSRSVSRTSPGLTPRAAPGKRGYCVACGKPANHLCLQTRDAVCGMECKLSNLSRKDPHRVQALSVKARIANKLQILQNDAYYLLRALIKLSHKALQHVPPEQAAVDSKLLSLTLLLSVMTNAGPTFQSNRNFIALVKVDLVHCLLRNSAASQIESIFTLSSQIFVAMLRAFKPHLHRSIGPMLDSIYLPYIQSPNSSFQHKCTSLQVIKSICDDPQLIVDLFLNYDCDLGQCM